MHFSTPINRPPYEANSEYLQVTSGCSNHNACAFCTFYRESRFSESPIEEIEADIIELSHDYYKAKRIFLQGADAFVLSYEQLMRIADLIHKYLPHVESIGGYARIDNIVDKTIPQLRALKENGYSNPYFGIESGDDVLLKQMNKRYTSDLVVEQCQKLEAADFDYIVNFLNGLGGHNYGMSHAHKTAEIYNDLTPTMIYLSSLTIMPGSRLARVAQTGRFEEASEIEKLIEMKEFIQHLTTPTMFRAEHVSIAVPISGYIHRDKETMIAKLQSVIDSNPEQNLRGYRDRIVSL